MKTEKLKFKFIEDQNSVAVTDLHGRTKIVSLEESEKFLIDLVRLKENPVADSNLVNLACKIK